MAKIAKKILFPLFIIAFFITAPLVILYTAGYRYDFTKGTVVQTGSFFITSTPKGASVYLNEKIQKETTPTVVQNLYPNDYVVRLSKEGYYDWEKKLPIQSQLTTFVDEVTLFLKANPQNVIDQEFVDPIFSNTNLLLYKKTEQAWIQFWIYDLNSQRQFMLTQINTHSADDITAEWSANGAAVLITKTHNGLKTFSIIEISNLNASTDLENFIAGPIEKVYWHPDFGTDIFIVTDQATYLLNLGSRLAEQIYPEPVEAYTRFDRLYITKDAADYTELWKMKPTEEIVAQLPKSQYSFQTASEPYVLLQDTARDRLILISLDDEQPILFNSEAEEFAWHASPSRGSQILFHNGFEVHVYSTTSFIDELITRVSTPITGLAWHPAGNNIFMATDNKIEAIELDSRDQRNVYELVAGSNLDGLIVPSSARELFFVGSTGDQSGLYQLPLID